VAFPSLALGLALVAILPPYIGPQLDVAARVELMDHVIPAAVIAVVGFAGLVAARRRKQGPNTPLIAGLLVALAGFWMVATHLQLLAQAARDEVPIGAAVWHATPGGLVLGVGLAWTFHAAAHASA